MLHNTEISPGRWRWDFPFHFPSSSRENWQSKFSSAETAPPPCCAST